VQQEQPQEQAEVSNELIYGVERSCEICNLCNCFLTSKAGYIMIALAVDKSEEE